MQRNPRRGIHAPHTQHARVLLPTEYEALGLLHVGSISILDYQLEDEAFCGWLARRAQDGLEAYVRLYAEWGTVPEPGQVAERIKNLATQHPWVTAWIPWNEMNLESACSADEIRQWLTDLFYATQWYRANGATFRLLVPSFAQDYPRLGHVAAYAACAEIIGLWLENGDGISWHDYWSAAAPTRMIEREMPSAICERLPNVPTLIHECGRVPDEAADFATLGAEFLARYGTHAGERGLTVAHAVTPWLLSSADPQFDGQAWMDAGGGFRQPLYDWGAWGP